jgi:hypothetical protein
MVVNLIADLLIAFASIGFLIADFKQGWKLYKNKNYSTKAFSKTHWKLKIISLTTVIFGYVLLGLTFAIIVATMQLFLSIYIMKKIGWRNMPRPLIKTKFFKELNK